MAAHATDDRNEPGSDAPGTAAVAIQSRRTLPIEALRYDLAEFTLALQQLLDLGPGENPEALRRVTSLLARLRKKLPDSPFREERLRDLQTDFALWFSKGPRLKFDYNDEALRSMLQVDIHRLNGAGQ